MSKNIVIFSDGTDLNGGLDTNINSNVYRLFNMIEDRTSRQVAFYDPGVGTTGKERWVGLMGGLGISKNILQCYRFIYDQFESGDSIYLFGFSRGAATVRSLAGFIHLFGILPANRPELIERAYKIYRISSNDVRNKKAKEFLAKNHTMWVRIKFIGVWDTVPALGLPVKWLDKLLDKTPWFHWSFHNFDLTPCIENAYHALALDERRVAFTPALWNSNTVQSYQSLRQVWFCGAHTDVGGGNDGQGVSNIALNWIINRAQKHGLLIYEKNQVDTTENIDDKLNDSGIGLLRHILYPQRKQRVYDSQVAGRPVVHESVLRRKLNLQNQPDSTYSTWITGMNPEVEKT